MINEDSTAIKIDNLSKKYSIGGKSSSSLRDSLASMFSRKKKEEFWALKDINLDIKKGEVTGIIGNNGAGKSTLLKILSKITHPTTGRVRIDGKVASLLEVGTGFHHELTGRENIFLNGSLLGMKKNEIKNQLDEIISFSGVEKFIDTPVKHYSSGMYVRLAFSVASHLNSDILLVDEVLTVGDAGFQKKCLNKMEGISKTGKTVLLISHNMSQIKNLCSRVILIDQGSVIDDGAPELAINKYLNTSFTDNSREINSFFELSSNAIIKADTIIVNTGEKLYFNLLFQTPYPDGLIVKVIIKDMWGRDLLIANSSIFLMPSRVDKGNQCTLHIHKLPLNYGNYKIEFIGKKVENPKIYFSMEYNLIVEKNIYYDQGIKTPGKQHVVLFDHIWTSQ